MEHDLAAWWCSSSSSNNNNWDLHAVVRFACGAGGQAQAPPSVAEPFPPSSSSCWLPATPQQQQPADAAASQPLLADPTAVDDLCLQSVFASPKPETPPPPQQQQQTSSPRNEGCPTPQQPPPPARSGTARSRRKGKKRQVRKEVARVPAAGPPADPWAWRKYGQKPIKGSPYPRGYYRCSTDKECRARKQVERCRDDPATLVVSYNGEHSHPAPLHRNSLAGTTRSKPRSSPAAGNNNPPLQHLQAAAALSPSATDDSNPQVGSPPSAGLSLTTPQGSPSAGEQEHEDDLDHADIARLLLENVEMADAAAADDELLFIDPSEFTPGPADAGCCDDDVMPTATPPTSTTAGSARTDGGARITNIAEEKFPITAAMEHAQAGGWGC